MKEPSSRQVELLVFLIESLRAGRSATIREGVAALGLGATATNAVAEMLKRLETKGYVRRLESRREGGQARWTPVRMPDGTPILGWEPKLGVSSTLDSPEGEGDGTHHPV
jgi:SOS-response transcriptional repressor LexA